MNRFFKVRRCLALFIFLALLTKGLAQNLVLDNHVSIVAPTNIDGPVKKAVAALQGDFQLMMNFRPSVTSELSDGSIQLVIVQGNKDNALALLPSDCRPELDGWESHRVFADLARNKLYWMI